MSRRKKPQSRGKPRASSEREEDKPDELGTTVVREVGETLRTLVRALSSPWLMVSVVFCCTLMYSIFLWRLPASDLKNANPVELIGEFISLGESAGFMIMGWVVLLLYVPISYLVFRVQHRRIRDQGRRLAAKKDTERPGRFSSKRPDHILREWKGEQP